MRRALLVFAACAILATASPAWATRYWVSTSGSDANACSAIDGDADPGVYKLTPFSAQSCLTVAGDRLTIKGGVYTGTGARITTFTGGTTGNHTIIEGDPSDAAGCGLTHTCTTIFRPASGTNTNIAANVSHWTMRKIDVDAVSYTTKIYPIVIGTPGPNTDILFEDVESHNGEASCIGHGYLASFVTYRRVHGHNCGVVGGHEGHGSYLQGDDTVIEDSSFHDNSSHGTQCYSSVIGETAARCTVRRSKFYDNGDTGLIIQGPDGVIYDNEVYGNAGQNGISIGSPSPRTKVYNNLVYNNGASGIVIRQTGNEVKNNIVFGNGGTEIQLIAPGTDAVLSNNACAVGDSCGTTGKLTIAALTDCTSSTSVFTLKASSSCIDVGTAVSTRGSPVGTTDIGPYEAPKFSVCTVEDGDASNLRITYSTAYPPMLPSSGATGITARKAGANDPVTTGTRVGDTRVDRVLTNAIINGDAVDISTAATNMTDSQTVGGTTAQPYVQTLTNQSCTNNVGAAASHVFTQAAFEFHGLRGTEAAPVGTPYATAPENTNVLVRVGGSVRLRLAITCTTADCPPTGFFPRYSKNAGGYSNVVPDTFGADNIGFCGTGPDPDIPTNGTATTDQLSTSGTFAAGALVRTSNAIPTVDIALNGKTELEYCFTFDTDATAADTYDIRVYQQDGTALNAYTVTPRMTLAAPSAGMGF
jgi:parallel beta-helix repeat protein